MSLSQQLVRRVLFPLDVMRRGNHAQLGYSREFAQTQWIPAESLATYQLRLLKKLLLHAQAQCPLYRERFERAGFQPARLANPSDLEAVPVLEKSDIQAHAEEMVARDFPRADLIPYQTGGSTGTALFFYLSQERKCSRAAAALRHNRWAGWDVGNKVAYLWGAPGDQSTGNWLTRMRQSILEPHVFLNTGHLTEAKLAEFHRVLHRFRPDIIQAYSRSAALLARYLKSRGLTPFRPRTIVTSAEVLEPEDRQVIEEVFGCPVFNRYGCREVGLIASECAEHQGLHVMAEGLYVEIVKGGRYAEPGEDGEILVTDLLNFAMPLIRYRIGDVGAWDEGPCPCGRGLPRLRHVTGRATDFLVGHDGRLIAGPFLAHSLVAKCPGLGRLQIQQERAGQVHFRIQPSAQFHELEDTAFLEATAKKYLGEGAAVDWELVDEVRSEPSGKFLFCRSSVSPAFLREGASAASE